MPVVSCCSFSHCHHNNNKSNVLSLFCSQISLIVMLHLHMNLLAIFSKIWSAVLLQGCCYLILNQDNFVSKRKWVASYLNFFIKCNIFDMGVYEKLHLITCAIYVYFRLLSNSTSKLIKLSNFYGIANEFPESSGRWISKVTMERILLTYIML